MRPWFRYLIRNSFFQVGFGIILVMLVGGVVLMFVEEGNIAQWGNSFWWAIVTMTTVGYGDFSPTTTSGRIAAVLVMFSGISLISLLTASISSIFVAKKIREGKGLEKIDVSDHVILCGWNKDGDQILDTIQNLNGDRKLDLVLINELNEDQINTLKSRYRNLKINFVSGDFTQEKILERGNLHKATTVVILPSGDPSVTNPDEKTIFATLTIKSLEPNVRTIAYLVNRDNLTHIRRANVDEVVLGDDFGSYILASHVIEPGIPQAVNSLLTSTSNSRFRRMKIPKEFIGKKYDDLFNHFRQKDGSLVIGLFTQDENLGIGAILSSDLSALDAFIEKKLKEGGISLQEESKIQVSINPDKDYIIQDKESAIIIP